MYSIKKRSYLLVFFLLLGIVSIGAKIASANALPAAAWIRVSPVILPLELVPGKQETYKIHVQNLLKTPLPLRVSMNDFDQTTEDGGYSFPETSLNPLISWTRMSENEFILQAGEKKEITLTVLSPKTIAAGGYYSMIFFEPVLPKSSATTVTTRVGILMLATVGFEDLNKVAGEILNFSLGSHVIFDPTLHFFLRVSNTSLRHFTAKPHLTLTSLFGEKKEYDPEEKLIFPGKVRRWDQKLPITVKGGIYRAELSVSTGNGNRVKAKTYFVYLPSLYAFGAACIAIVLAAFLLRRRLLSALKILVRG